MMNRKGNFPDIAEYLTVALMLALTITITMMFVINWNSSIQSMNETMIPADAKVGIANLTSALPGGFDWLFLFILIIFVGFSVAMARLIPSSPKFILISIITLFILPFAAMIVENVWSGWFQQPIVITALSGFKFLPFVMDKLVYITVFYSLIVMIALLTKNEPQ